MAEAKSERTQGYTRIQILVNHDTGGVRATLADADSPTEAFQLTSAVKTIATNTGQKSIANIQIPTIVEDLIFRLASEVQWIHLLSEHEAVQNL